MVRTVICAVVGAGAGFVAGSLGFGAVLGIAGGIHADTFVASVFVGVFLAGAGAIAGAVIGGTADLLGYLKRKDQAMRDSRGGAA